MAQERFEKKQHNKENKKLRRMGGTVFRRKTPPKEGGDVVEGRNPVIEALRSDRTVKRILLASGVGQSRRRGEDLPSGPGAGHDG